MRGNLKVYRVLCINSHVYFQSKNFMDFLQKLPVIRTVEGIFDEDRRSEVYECHSVLKTNRFVLSDPLVENIKLFLINRFIEYDQIKHKFGNLGDRVEKKKV